ncbi:hypothetical protein [Arenimonas oryziterrae]|uniref:DUF3619 family protein n=1 Tax=Arenimonas oryziterrae DSM 21050 = YC6267 TaxID=1121015 RepID=A0A091AXF0_9GAMM|nr:hypothetical protein [Arenimonas oryziterrae]KFN43344.1 hypothetical protein N789_08705 [Arenimonas oryziterrae DSM 21050 = YC6267]
MNGHDPNHLPDETASVDAARQLFDRAGDRLDTATANRLRLMRREALRGAAGPASRLGTWLPVGAAAVAVLALAIAWRAPVPEENIADTPDTELGTDPAVTGEDDAELYAWLGDAPVATTPGKAGTL